jgi:hypothetical protein
MGTLTRRRFAQALAGSGSIILAKPRWSEADVNKIRVRRDLYALQQNSPEILALKRGVSAMKSRPASDPTSWLFQANIHGTYDAVPPAASDVWNTCQHGSFFFLSWHRMYLYFFEKILRALSGDDDFALPYWNYSVPAQRSMPAIFRNPEDTSNPLFVSERNTSINNGQPLPQNATSFGQALGTVNFASPTGSPLSFGGQILAAPSHFTGPHGRLEAQPHDVIHVAVGGSGWMTDPNFAARDPIFWVHHCNIDRLWNHWIALGGGRTNPVNNSVWMKTAFNFHDEKGNKVQMTGADVLDSIQQLGYRYDDEQPRVEAIAAAPTGAESATMAGQEPTRVLASTSARESALALGSKTTTVSLQPAAAGAVESAVVQGSGPVVLSFDDIAYQRPVGTYYEVYINKPQDSPPDPNSPFYVGNLALFALGHSHDGVSGGKVMLEVTAALAQQRQLGLWSGGDIRVDLVPQGPEGAEAAQPGPFATIGQIRLLGR